MPRLKDEASCIDAVPVEAPVDAKAALDMYKLDLKDGECLPTVGPTVLECPSGFFHRAFQC